MTAATITYIVIEISEKENALDIVNTLITHTKARFTITKDIWEYAAERDKLGGTNGSSEQRQNRPLAKAVTTVNHPIRQESPDIEEIDAATYYSGFPVAVPKNEPSNDVPPESFGHSSTGGYSNMFPPPKANYDLQSSSSYSQEDQHVPYQPPSTTNNNNDFTSWQEPMEAVSNSNEATTSGLGNLRSRGRKLKKVTTRTPISSSSFQCAICKVMVKAVGFGLSKRKSHASIHLDIQRYKCPIDGCTYGSRHPSNMRAHVRVQHKITKSMRFPEISTEAENQELMSMVYHCFPEMRTKLIPATTGGGDDEEYGDNVEEVEDA